MFEGAGIIPTKFRIEFLFRPYPYFTRPMVLPGGIIYLFLNRIFEGEGMRFRGGGYVVYINERKFDEFYVKKRKKSKIPNLKLVMTCWKKVANLSNLTLVHFPGGQNLPHFLTSYTAQARVESTLQELNPLKTLEWLVIEKSDKNKSFWKLNFIAIYLKKFFPRFSRAKLT